MWFNKEKVLFVSKVVKEGDVLIIVFECWVLVFKILVLGMWWGFYEEVCCFYEDLLLFLLLKLEVFLLVFV